MSTLRPLLLAGAVLGVCHLAGVPVWDWLISVFQILYYVISALLWAFWQLLQPNQTNPHSGLPVLHQAVLNVTNDASRVADLLEEFMSQYSSDNQLKEKFLQFMADQADTKYSVVDNKLNWVLWLYSLIWMPLLVLMCLTRIGKGSSSHVEERQQQTAPTGVVMNGYQQQQRSAGAFPGSVAGGEQQGLRVQTSIQQQQPELSGFSSSTAARRRVLSAGSSLDLPPRYSVPGSFGRPAGGDDGDSMRSASGRSLRSAMSNITERQRQRASSDRVHMSRPSKLQGSSSLPPNVLLTRGGSGGSGGSSGSLKGVPGYVQGSSSKRVMAGYAAAADPAGLQGSNSSSGADVRAAPGLDQALAGSGGSGGMW